MICADVRTGPVRPEQPLSGDEGAWRRCGSDAACRREWRKGFLRTGSDGRDFCGPERIEGTDADAEGRRVRRPLARVWRRASCLAGADV